jgi:hypothetical protein
VLVWGAAGLSGVLTARWLYPGYEATTASALIKEFAVPRAGTAAKLFIYANSPGVGAQILTYVVTKNGLPTALLVVTPETIPLASDLVNSVVYAAGDRIGVFVTKTGAMAGAGPVDIQASLTFV